MGTTDPRDHGQTPDPDATRGEPAPGAPAPDPAATPGDAETPRPGSDPTRQDVPLPDGASGFSDTRVGDPSLRPPPPPGRRISRRAMLFGGIGAAGLTAVTAYAADEIFSRGSSVRHSAGHAAGMAGPRPSVPAQRTAPPASWTNAPIQSSRTPLFDLRELTPPAPPTAVTLTIDDGPHPVYTPMMLDLLAENGIKATFSLIGMQVKMFPKLVARIAADGHQISNHSQNHPSPFTAIGHDRIRREIIEAKERIENAAGFSPRFFRSPGGDWNRYVFEQCRSQGMMPIAWNIDPRDWSRPGTPHIRRAMLAAKAGDVLLCHDGGGDRRQTLEALRTVLPALKKRGLTFVTL
ncbi:polysaccharide deacetylase family protein [Spirillospora sp. NPDC052269]